MRKKFIVGIFMFVAYLIPSAYYSLNISECDPQEVGDMCCDTVFSYQIDSLIFNAIPFSLLSVFLFFYFLPIRRNILIVSIGAVLGASCISFLVTGLFLWDWLRGCYFCFSFSDELLISLIGFGAIIVFSLCLGLIQGGIFYCLQKFNLINIHDLI